MLFKNPVADVFVITMRKRICTLLTTFYEDFFLFDSIFSELVWIISLTMVAMEIGKR